MRYDRCPICPIMAPEKYHKFVAICILTSDILSGIAWYYGDNDFIIQTFDFIIQTHCTFRHTHMTCSTNMDSHVTCSKNTAFSKLRAVARLSH